MTLALIWAQTPAGVIGDRGTIPWRVPEDQARFRRLTTGHPVLMGRATWDSLPERFRPLPGRENLVLTRTPGWAAPGAVVVTGVAEAMRAIAGRDAWVIGGGQVYAELLARADRLEVTEVDVDVPGDATAPRVDPLVWAPVAAEPDDGPDAGPDAGPDGGPDGGPDDGWRVSTTGVRYRYLAYRRRRPGDATGPRAGRSVGER